MLLSPKQTTHEHSMQTGCSAAVKHKKLLTLYYLQLLLLLLTL